MGVTYIHQCDGIAVKTIETVEYEVTVAVRIEDDISYNLTKLEALTYLEHVLGIPDPISLLNKNKVAFLQELMQQTMLKIPFTNIPSFREGKFKGLSLKEIKEAVFKREGGNCLALNTFTGAVLECLGFDVYLIGGSAQQWKVPLLNTHTAVIAKHLTSPGSLHLLDVGNRYFFPLTALDFDRISQVYPMKKWQYRFFQVSPGVVQLTRKCEPPKPGRADGLIYAESDEYWEVLMTFQTSTPMKLAECQYQNDLITQNPEMAHRVVDGFLLISYPNNLLFNITNNYCMIEMETGDTEVTQVKNSLQVVDTILKYFPQYSRNLLESMANYFTKKSQKKNIL
ncbi:hypothetical protein HOLleu_12283 [Holothuria leucospilota]|uniref:arylamine N-acetyltransferase n=1 Tax=Holothuria leucospilota TaxID=206669 RepID=A0A9Q1HCY3_HOLLE|nr:hypothetical protein HOLleu_12283 [Holothuria leucospilota]